MMVRYLAPLFTITVFLTSAGCDGLPTACTRELRVYLAPADTTITVGQSFAAAVELSSCGGRETLSDDFTWESQDTTVAVVGAATGRVTGVGPGQADVVVTGERYGQLGGIRVVVQAARSSPQGSVARERAPDRDFASKALGKGLLALHKVGSGFL